MPPPQIGYKRDVFTRRYVGKTTDRRLRRKNNHLRRYYSVRHPSDELGNPHDLRYGKKKCLFVRNIKLTGATAAVV
jgi:hypothetical protein